MALPFLPGNVIESRHIGKEKFHLQHHFDVVNNVQMNVGEDKKHVPNHSNIPRGSGVKAPTWIAFDKQVLRFEAYYKEAIVESSAENYRVHKVKILFYLEDDTIQVIEPESKNSGIPQGDVIGRRRINLPVPLDNLFYTVEHFNIGNEVEFYGKRFMLCDCDEFTRNFLRKLGVKLNAVQPIPDDPYSLHRKMQEEAMQPLRPYERIDKLGQFLEHSRHVLRFFLTWDDTDTMYGDMREFVLHYFLADDQIEIKEVIPPNSGRDTLPIFLHKGFLPKKISGLALPGVRTDRTVLNVFGPMGAGGRYILDSLKSGKLVEEYYHDSDLMVGATINVWGRKLVICDCDEFTKQYYATKYGVDFKPIKLERVIPPPPIREVPPYNGIGSYEDSLGNCDSLLPKPPQRDFMKFMEKDRNGLESNILRFAGKILTRNKVNKERLFIISYFLSDDTISVFEPPVNNSGIVPGKFIERSRQPKPGTEKFSSVKPEYYEAGDMYVGAKIVLQEFCFHLVDADKYTLTYMEKNAGLWPQSNIGYVMYKIRSTIGSVDKTQFESKFHSQDGTVSASEFNKVINEITGNQLTEAELFTLRRAYTPDLFSDIPLQSLNAAIQEYLRRSNFEYFQDLLNALMLRDTERTGMLHASEVRKTCLAMHLGVPIDMLSYFVSRIGDPSSALVDYRKFVQLVNWRDNAIPTSVKYTIPIKCIDWTPDDNQEQRINYGDFIDNLFQN